MLSNNVTCVTEVYSNVPCNHITKEQLPDLAKTSKGLPAQKQVATQLNLSYILNRLRIKPLYDVGQKRVVYCIPDGEGGVFPPSSSLKQDELRQDVIDTCRRLGIAVTNSFDYEISLLAKQTPFHVFNDWLNKHAVDEVTWDPMLPKLLASVRSDSPLKDTYITRTLIGILQAAVWAVAGRECSYPNLLIMIGAQGVGKGSWYKKLLPLLPFMIQLDAPMSFGGSNKDEKLNSLRYLMVELSELGGMVRKADLEALKSDLSRMVDTIRAVYAARPDTWLRATIFVASSNVVDILRDWTGSRRYWPLIVDSFDWGFELSEEEMIQLWQEIRLLWLSGETHMLTAAEDKMRLGDAGQFEAVSTEAELADNYLAHFVGLPPSEYKWGVFNKTNAAMLFNNDKRMSQVEVRGVGQYLTKHWNEPRKILGAKRSWVLPIWAKKTVDISIQDLPKDNAGAKILTSLGRAGLVNYGQNRI